MIFPLAYVEQCQDDSDQTNEKLTKTKSETNFNSSGSTHKTSLSTDQSWITNACSVVSALCLLISCLTTYFFIKGFSDWIGKSLSFAIIPPVC
jgi:hypothetical protein